MSSEISIVVNLLQEAFWTVIGGGIGAVISLIVAGELKKPDIVFEEVSNIGRASADSSPAEQIIEVRVRNQPHQIPILDRIRRNTASECTIEVRHSAGSDGLDYYFTGGWRNPSVMDALSDPRDTMSIYHGGKRSIPIAKKKQGEDSINLLKLVEGEFREDDSVDEKKIEVRVRSGSGNLWRKKLKLVSTGEKAHEYEVYWQ